MLPLKHKKKIKNDNPKHMIPLFGGNHLVLQIKRMICRTSDQRYKATDTNRNDIAESNVPEDKKLTVKVERQQATSRMSEDEQREAQTMLKQSCNQNGVLALRLQRVQALTR